MLGVGRRKAPDRFDLVELHRQVLDLHPKDCVTSDLTVWAVWERHGEDGVKRITMHCTSSHCEIVVDIPGHEMSHLAEHGDEAQVFGDLRAILERTGMSSSTARRSA